MDPPVASGKAAAGRTAEDIKVATVSTNVKMRSNFFMGALL
jgi:hypothetical protein